MGTDRNKLVDMLLQSPTSHARSVNFHENPDPVHTGYLLLIVAWMQKI